MPHAMDPLLCKMPHSRAATRGKEYHLFLPFCLNQFSRQPAPLLRSLHFRVQDDSVSSLPGCSVSATCGIGTWWPGRTRTRPLSPSFFSPCLATTGETRTLQHESLSTNKSPTVVRRPCQDAPFESTAQAQIIRTKSSSHGRITGRLSSVTFGRQWWTPTCQAFRVSGANLCLCYGTQIKMLM